ncbi:alpha-glucan family phosphorylase [Methylacidimicrobium sp. B4]|uniref:alpha-glucan family phosphorylase n=1 Tax=Methylacidimicrobium sp. B4 TaxID=2796139 RepID=UPI001A8D56A7|nr:alpha-glucan family phosphorylase [Methylacidimicrobium sp. B4]QSR84599.1 alpha-glucan family phosphorylase [Methylacidimicrobium sp. B4]
MTTIPPPKPDGPPVPAGAPLRGKLSAKVAYFSMEIAVDEKIPSYSGGLGVLAADTLRAAAGSLLPMVGVTLLYRRGYFFQRFDAQGWQREEGVVWSPDRVLCELGERVSVLLEGRTVQLRSWLFWIRDAGEGRTPILFLDSDLPENSEWDRTLSHYLYGGDSRYRLCQEAILGIGGVRMLRKLGFAQVELFHMNEGHSSLLILELLEEEARRSGRTEPVAEDVEAVRRKCAFTTHTPVSAGHDRFPLEMVRRTIRLPAIADSEYRGRFCCAGEVNLTHLAFQFSHYINGVAKRHSEVSRALFYPARIDSITNGIHVPYWTSPPMQELFDRHIPGWRADAFSIRYAIAISLEEIRRAHEASKAALLEHVNRETNAGMSMEALTIGFARRATAYKRAELILTDIERLKRMAREKGPIQLLFAGKAHPQDDEGKRTIQRIIQAQPLLLPDIRMVYLAEYDLALARLLVAGVDLWLNTPQPPMEASGTSGMKAAVNGVPSLSVLDGWWIEGCIEGVTGWSVGPDHYQRNESSDVRRDAADLYAKLEGVIVPLFYGDADGFARVMRQGIALNASFFNAQRMLQQYVLKAYFA